MIVGFRVCGYNGRMETKQCTLEVSLISTAGPTTAAKLEDSRQNPNNGLAAANLTRLGDHDVCFVRLLACKHLWTTTHFLARMARRDLCAKRVTRV